MSATAITLCFQNALYFSLLSVLPFTTRWMIALSSTLAIFINGASMTFMGNYQSKTSERLCDLQESMKRRVNRFEHYADELKVRLTVGVGSESDLRRRLSRTAHAREILQSQQRTIDLQALRLTRHERYLRSKMSPRLVGLVLVALQASLGLLAASPALGITIAVVFASLMLGIVIAARCTFTLVLFRTEVIV
jgi:hypothetical protein